MSDPAVRLDPQSFGVVCRALGLPDVCRAQRTSKTWQDCSLEPSIWRKIDLGDFGKTLPVGAIISILRKFPNVTDLRLMKTHLNAQVLSTLGLYCKKLVHLDLKGSTLFDQKEDGDEASQLKLGRLKTIDLRGARYNQIRLDCMSLESAHVSKGMSHSVILCSCPENALHEDGDILVKIKTLTGKMHFLWVPNVDETIAGIKERFEEFEGVPADCQRYIYCGKRLEDGRRLRDYNFRDGTVLHLVLRLRGGLRSHMLGLEPVETTSMKDYRLQSPELTTFSRTFLEDDFNKNLRHAHHNSLTKVTDGVYSLPMFNKTFISKLCAEVYNIQEQIHPPSIGTKAFEALGYRPFLDDFIRNYLAPFSQNLFREFHGAPLTEYDTFIVFYSQNGDYNFGVHQDPSDITVNLCLKNTAQGCDLSFFAPNDEKTERKYLRVTPVEGHAFVHKGNLFHKVEDLETGQRCNLVIWMRFRK